MALARTCSCGRRVEPGHTCICGAGAKRQTNAERSARYPYTQHHGTAGYKRNRKLRYELAQGRCESCGTPVGASWHCDHMIEARLFADPEHANAVENLRVLCKPCHKAKTRASKRR